MGRSGRGKEGGGEGDLESEELPREGVGERKRGKREGVQGEGGGGIKMRRKRRYGERQYEEESSREEREK